MAVVIKSPTEKYVTPLRINFAIQYKKSGRGYALTCHNSKMPSHILTFPQKYRQWSIQVVKIDVMAAYTRTEL